jgi:hypothetical protein
MTEHPIIFSGSMVRAILEGRKAQSRRVIKTGRGAKDIWAGELDGIWVVERFGDPCSAGLRCPYGKPGDRLWVRESFYIASAVAHEYGIGYRADHVSGNLLDGDGGYNFRSFSQDPDTAVNQRRWAKRHIGTDRWQPSIFMPRWASRITLEITDVRVQRLQEISEQDALAEGCESWALTPEDVADIRISDESPEMKQLAEALGPGQMPARAEYRMLWDTRNRKRGFGWDVNPFVWAISFRRIQQQQERAA